MVPSNRCPRPAPGSQRGSPLLSSLWPDTALFGQRRAAKRGGQASEGGGSPGDASRTSWLESSRSTLTRWWPPISLASGQATLTVRTERPTLGSVKRLSRFAVPAASNPGTLLLTLGKQRRELQRRHIARARPSDSTALLCALAPVAQWIEQRFLKSRRGVTDARSRHFCHFWYSRARQTEIPFARDPLRVVRR
jgi:hypothetical protein